MSALAQSLILPHGAAQAPCADPVGAGLRGLIGKTPLLAIKLEFRGQAARIYAKAEFRNLTGSIKDRMALGVLSASYERGELVPGQRIVEATSGNAGIALAALGRAMGHPVTIFMPDWMSQERRALLSAHGAEVKLVSAEEGGFLGSIDRARTFAAATGGFLSRQFDNDDNWRAHFHGTGRELLTQMALAGARPDAFVAGVGTGGTVMGVARRFARAGMSAAVHPVEPAESPTLSTGYKVGRHRIQGVSDEFIPDIVKLDELAPVIAVNDGDAILMAQAMARDLGLGVGISSGGNIVAALKVLAERGPRTTVATVLCDNSARYLSTDLAREEPVQPGYLTPDARLLGFEVVGG